MTSKLNHKYLKNYLTFYYQYVPHLRNYPADKKQTTIEEGWATPTEANEEDAEA